MKGTFLAFFISMAVFGYQAPNGFVYLTEIDSTIQKDLRYFSGDNFMGVRVAGYVNNRLIISKPAAVALVNIQKELAKQGLGLKIFDAYRPQQAVDHFVKWSKNAKDTIRKANYYPNIAKHRLFAKGYIASKSGHTRGSTVDLTLVNLATGKELDMGSAYDFFGNISHPFYENLSKTQKENRMLLRNIMLRHQFIPYNNEWWHFTLRNEPYPKTYFNFLVQ